MGYSDDVVLAAWEKATIIPNSDSALWRKDACGAWIQFSRYGDRSSQYGWEIDHVHPSTPHDVENIVPLHLMNRLGKGDGRLICGAVASGMDNKFIGEAVELKEPESSATAGRTDA